MTNRYDPPPRSAHHFTSRLDDEWQELRRQRRSLQRARAWATSAPGDSLRSVLANLTDLDDLLKAARCSRGHDGPDNAVLLRLVEIARHDQLAGRIVIQRLLPGLIKRAAAYRSYYDDTDPAEIIVPAAWLALRNYDVDRRRHHVAASLLSDATFFAFRKQLRRLSANEIVCSPRSFLRKAAPVAAKTPLEELASVVRDAQAAGVNTYDIDLIRHLVRAASPGTVARERNVTTRTIRNHRARAVTNVRKALAIAA